MLAIFLLHGVQTVNSLFYENGWGSLTPTHFLFFVPFAFPRFRLTTDLKDNLIDTVFKVDVVVRMANPV